MLTITGLVSYHKRTAKLKARKAQEAEERAKLTRAERVKKVRAARAAEGLCQNHGTELPCGKCAAATKRWRDGRKKGKRGKQ